jgi:tetratricopeptide (TPR) repeat protein
MNPKKTTNITLKHNKLIQNAVALHQSGQLDLAEAEYKKLLTSLPSNTVLLTNLGTLALQKRNLEEAVRVIGRSLQINPNQPFAHFNCANALKDLKRLDEALISYNQAIIYKPDYAEAFSNRGIIFKKLNRPNEALDSYNQALALKPDQAAVYFNRAIILNDLNRFEEALVSYDRAISLKPDYAEAYSNRGNSLKKINLFELALVSYDCALKLRPDFAEAHMNRGTVLSSLNRFEEALASYECAIRLNPVYVEAYSNRGLVLKELNRIEDALASYDRAIALNANYAEAYSNRGIALKECKQFDEALVNYDRAITLKADYAEAYWNKSLLKLLLGDYEQGWALYEWRRKKDDTKNNYREYAQPLWMGEQSLTNKTVFIYSEQGLGDVIQFIRYIALVEQLGAKVILEVPKILMAIVSTLQGGFILVEPKKTLPDFDYHCPLMSLPLAFKTTMKTIPVQVPYLFPLEEKMNRWKKVIGDQDFKIGISWQGSAGKEGMIARSFPIQLLEDIAKIKGIRLISLQKNEGVDQLAGLPQGMRVERLPDDFDNEGDAFLDSIAIMKCLDLVITCDTSIAHLAGALNLQTWVALIYVPDFRWLLDKTDSPWYPKHRLFRQTTRNDWVTVFQDMAENLKKMVKH